MRKISKKNLDIIKTDPYYKRCLKNNQDCYGRLTIEHALIYSGRQIDEIWALLPLCWYHHLGPGLDKNFNRWVALCRATDEDLGKYSKANFQQLKKSLIIKFGGEYKY